jgi:hypothetical protein
VPEGDKCLERGDNESVCVCVWGGGGWAIPNKKATAKEGNVEHIHPENEPWDVLGLSGFEINDEKVGQDEAPAAASGNATIFQSD